MNNIANIILKPNSLWQNLTQQTEHALNYGALKSIPTEYELIQYEEIDFLVRILITMSKDPLLLTINQMSQIQKNYRLKLE